MISYILLSACFSTLTLSFRYLVPYRCKSRAQLPKKEKQARHRINRFRVIENNKLIQLVLNEEEREEVGGRWKKKVRWGNIGNPWNSDNPRRDGFGIPTNLDDPGSQPIACISWSPSDVLYGHKNVYCLSRREIEAFLARNLTKHKRTFLVSACIAVVLVAELFATQRSHANVVSSTTMSIESFPLSWTKIYFLWMKKEAVNFSISQNLWKEKWIRD